MVNGLEGDYERIETLLASAAQARAKDFPEGGTPPGLRRKLRLTWHTSSGDQSLEILSSSQKNKEAPRLYLKSPLLKEVVEIESNLNVQLDRTATYLRRNLLITQAEKINITTASLEGKAYSQTIRFSFDGKNWTQTAGDPKLNPEKVRELLTALSEGHSPELVAPAPREESPPVTLTLGDSKQPARFVFKVYPAKGKNWARIAGSPRNEAFELEARAGKAFPFQPDSWKLK
jgi:hypothetical protein